MFIRKMFASFQPAAVDEPRVPGAMLAHSVMNETDVHGPAVTDDLAPIAGADPVGGLLASVRFPAELRMMNEMRSRFGLDELLQHLEETQLLAPHHQAMMSEMVRLTPLLAPRIYRLVDEVRDRLEFHLPFEVFVNADAAINAYIVPALAAEEPAKIGLSSTLIREMTDDEVRFVLGHELGHLAYGHARLSAVRLAMAMQHHEDEQQSGSPVAPQLIDRRIDGWMRLSELSADRAGFIACDGQLETAIAVFFKMSSGLGPEHLRFDMQAFIEQLERILQLDRREITSLFSHPVTPVRARALQIHHDVQSGSRLQADADEEVERLAALMDYEATSDLARNARDFLVGAGLLAAHADGDASAEEMDLLIRMLLPLTGDPEAQLRAVTTGDQAQGLFEQSADWLRENSGQERFGLFGHLCNIVAVDSKLSPGERTFMMQVAARLGIPERSARETLHQVLTGHVRRSSQAGTGFMGLRG